MTQHVKLGGIQACATPIWYVTMHGAKIETKIWSFHAYWRIWYFKIQFQIVLTS